MNRIILFFNNLFYEKKLLLLKLAFCASGKPDWQAEE